jgi:amyloid beta precursor protein binding protein 1
MPLSGALPDMVSTTDFYLQLQQIYIEKAKKDVELMHTLVTKVMEARGVSAIDEEQFALFCKNTLNIDCIEMRSIHDELTSPDWSCV